MNNILSKTVSLLITDDHLVIQQGIAGIIREFLIKSKFSFASSLKTTLDALRNEQFDLLILDLNIPGGNSFEMIQQIRAIQSDIKILLFSAYNEETYGLRYIKAGANGYLEKSSSEQEIQEAVMKVLLKGRYISQKIQEQMIDGYSDKPGANKIDKLTLRELEIVRLLINGERTSDISQKLDLKLSTISTYKNRIFEKLQISNIPELIKEFSFNLE